MISNFFAFVTTILLMSQLLPAQVTVTNNWCMSQCDLAGDERTNTDKIHQKCQHDTLRRKSFASHMLAFPLRVGIIQPETEVDPALLLSIDSTLTLLNEAFQPAGIEFYTEITEIIQSPLKINDLSVNQYEPYSRFSQQHDRDDLVSLYIFNYDEDLCKTEDGATSCGRVGGFSYILSETTNNVVLSKFDLEDHKIIAHEFGHFFGLFHTFEEFQFGKEKNSGSDCESTGDRICDTPPDPGTLYEVYVNYSKCEMLGFKDEDGIPYKPLINNIMSYYKPCYLQKFSFTPGQIRVIRFAAESDLRIKYSR